MKIGIIGSGGVAQILGSGFVEKGHDVMLGTRDASKLSEWLEKSGDGASVGSFTESAVFGEIVFLAVNSSVLNSAIEMAGVENLSDKTVVDVSNPMDFSQGMPPKFTVSFGNSLGEQVQRALPDANVVKAFNTIGADIMTDPKFGDETATHLIAGDNDDAKAEVSALIKEFGWEVEDLGGIDQAFFLEAFASIWVNYSIKSGSRNHAFRLLKR